MVRRIMSVVDEGTLMRMHVAALFTQDAAGRLVSVNEPNGKLAPRLFFGRTSQENVWFVRHDLDASLVKELDAACREESVSREVVAGPALAERLSAILAASSPVERTWAGPAFVCPIRSTEKSAIRVDRSNADLLSPYLKDWRVDAEERGVPMAVSLQDGRAVSVCCSVRISEEAHEAGVETHANFRGRGHAMRAVAEWAEVVRGMGRVPLYSTSWENNASRRLAARLQLLQFGADLHIT